jgi:hypothetical protein
MMVNVTGLQITHWAFITAVVLIGVAYVLFCLYLTIDMVIYPSRHCRTGTGTRRKLATLPHRQNATYGL